MNKKQPIDESPEVKYYEKKFKEMREEMEADEQTNRFEMPEEWDRDFRKLIDEAYKEERRKRMQKLGRRLRIGTFVAVVGAVVFFCNPVTVQGASFLEVVQEFFGLIGKNFMTFGINEDELEASVVEQNEIFFDVKSLDEVYEQLSQEVSDPMFYIPYVPDGYILVEARYDKVFRILNLKLEKEEKIIYITQQWIIDESASGIVMDEQEKAVAVNKNLEQRIPIFVSEQDNSLSFSIRNKCMTVSFLGEVTLEECKEIAQKIYYK
ncbi:MAG: hypothetical protein KH828_00015 [Clostridiales bacterium]|nr:hypothetical protein [Clostridiales bacterium]